MRRASLVLSAGLLLFPAGCEERRKYDRDTDRICNAAKLSGAADEVKGTDGAAKSKRAMKMALWLEQNLESEHWKAWFKGGSGDPGKRNDELRKAAKAAGLASCPILDE